MGIFSVIAEAKILDWLRRKKTGEIQDPEPSATATASKSYQSYLLEDIKRLIEQAAGEPAEKRRETEQKAQELEIQLLASLENEGLNLMAKMTADQLNEHRRQHRPPKPHL